MDEFREMPNKHIENTYRQHKNLMDTYLTLDTQLRNYNRIAPSFSKIKKKRVKFGNVEDDLVASGSDIPKELQAAKKKAQEEAEKRRKTEEVKRAEELNLLQAQRNGEMNEWCVRNGC